MAARRYAIRTFGCQMNLHDSEKLANLLHHHGYRPARQGQDPDLLLINTCSIREKAEHKLYSDLGTLRAWRAGAPGRILGVGGCVAQQVGDGLLRRFSHLDFVFGTHNLRWVPSLVDAALAGRRLAQVGETLSPDRFDLPERHPDTPSATPGRAFLTVMEGCDMFCSFCIVPRTRGREVSRSASAILAEARDRVEGGVREITLLGQTVNAYGRHDVRRGQTRQSGTLPFPALLRRLGRIRGLERIRYTSPHPLFVDPDLIRVHGELPSLCPHVHLPVQSGSDAVLARMRRRHTALDYRRIIDALRGARPDLVVTTDVIVGFPGETEADFQATLRLMEDVGFVDSFSFKYSPRPGTAAETWPDPVPPDQAQERLERLQSLQRSLTLGAHRGRVGERTEVLVEGRSRHGSQLSGRDPYHRVVNFSTGEDRIPEPGAEVPVQIVEATPHSLIGELRGA